MCALDIVLFPVADVHEFGQINTKRLCCRLEDGRHRLGETHFVRENESVEQFKQSFAVEQAIRMEVDISDAKDALLAEDFDWIELTMG